MSEPQTGYETDTDAQPTPGPWHVDLRDSVKIRTESIEESGPWVCDVTGYVRRDDQERQANAELIAAAGTAAQKAKEMGYDPVAAVEALPDLLAALQDVNGMIEQLDLLAALQDVDGMIEQLKYGTIRMMVEDALASAEGSRDE